MEQKAERAAACAEEEGPPQSPVSRVHACLCSHNSAPAYRQNSIRLASGHASAIRQEPMLQFSTQARSGSQRVVVLYMVMRGRFVPQSSHARLVACLLVTDRRSSTRADGRSFLLCFVRPGYASASHQIMTNRSGFAPFGTVLVIHEVKK